MESNFFFFVFTFRFCCIFMEKETHEESDNDFRMYESKQQKALMTKILTRLFNTAIPYHNMNVSTKVVLKMKEKTYKISTCTGIYIKKQHKIIRLDVKFDC